MPSPVRQRELPRTLFVIAGPNRMDPIQVVAILAITIAAPIFAAIGTARGLRMKDDTWKFFLIYLAIFASTMTILVGQIKFGIDLEGGFNLIYEVDQSSASGSLIADAEKMDRLMDRIRKRVDPGGVRETTIRQIGPNRIEIIVPGKNADDKEKDRVKKIITETGTLEFRIVANPAFADHKQAIAAAKAQMELDPAKFEQAVYDALPSGDLAKDSQRGVLARWVPVAVMEGENNKSVPRWTPAELEGGKNLYEPGKTRGDNFRKNPNNNDRLEVLVMNDVYNVTGQFLVRANPSQDDVGKPAVAFSFNSAGGHLFGMLTGANLPNKAGQRRNLAIVYDNELWSAPTIESRIQGNGIIRGQFQREEVRGWCDVLNAGALPLKLNPEPVMELLIDPTLGVDTIQAGKISIAASLLAVLIFMAWYYRFAGVIACVAILVNLLILVAAMIFMNAAFTLPGLAGVVLTVGMAVDANVLIFERMREEQDRGATMRMVIRNGFSRALSAIIDSNLTSLITAVALYVCGTDQVKGFAVSLFLGIVISMFTSIFCSRVVFDVAERGIAGKRLHRLRFKRLLDHTNYDFFKYQWPAIYGSTVVVLIGLAALLTRGTQGLDIDFTGGTVVHVQFKDSQDFGKIRREIESVYPEANVKSGASTTNLAEAGKRYIVETRETDLLKVEEKLTTLFGNRLVHNSVALAEPFEDLIEVIKVEPKAVPATGETKTESKEPSKEPAGPESEDAPARRPRRPESAVSAIGPSFPYDPSRSLPVLGRSWNAPLSVLSLLAAQVTQPAPETQAPASDESEAPGRNPGEWKTAAADPKATPGKSGRIPFDGGIRLKTKFTLPMSYKTLQEYLNTGIQKQEGNPVDPEKKAINFYEKIRLENPKYKTNSDQKFDEWTVELDLPRSRALQLLEDFRTQLASEPFFPNSSEIGTAVARTFVYQAIVAILASLFFIIGYLWFRFRQVMYGLAATVAVIHDAMITLGFVGLSFYLAQFMGLLLVEDFRINLTMVAALLTIIGYSLNDTIVIFDRVREIRGKSPHLTAEMINLAMNQTLSRTILTSATTLIVVVILYVFGGAGIHGFAYAMLVGVITGSYSTIFIASPVVLWLHGSWEQQTGRAPLKKPHDAEARAKVE